MAMEESISLEETNKIRISLGLKPLTDDSAPADDKDKQAESNYAKQREQQNKDKDSKKIQDRIAKVRNRRELNASLKGSTLGDTSPAEADESTLKWLKKAKKREKELARKRVEEQESMDKVFMDDYTERDLVGLKVSHDFDEMDEGDAKILTLKDSRILDDEEDELQNVEMAEYERTEKNNELKTKNRAYTGYDDDEFVEGSVGMKKKVLAKYDEEEGPNEFRLGSSTAAVKAKQELKNAAAGANDDVVLVNRSLLSIDYAKNIETADYLKEGDVGFKKPKTKKKRPSRRTALEPEPTTTTTTADLDVDMKPVAPRVRELDSNFVDDDDLQAALARSRRAKLKKSGGGGAGARGLAPEDIARRVAEQRKEEEARARDVIDVDGDEEGAKREEDGLTFDDTSEFVRAITYNPGGVKVEAVERRLDVSRGGTTQPEDVPMTELEAGETQVKDEEDEEDDMAILDAIENALKSADAEQQQQQQPEPEAVVADGDAVGGTSSEQTFSTGMASTLNILRNQGILSAPVSDQKEREQTQLQRDLWLADQRRRVAQREMEKLASRGANKDQAQREYENRQREAQEARENLEAFKHYKPDVNIVYYDEFGRALTPKEAWKALSHKFHGKGSGKMKTEKRLKRIAEEKKKEGMSSGDTPLSMNRAFQIRQERAGQAHMVLSVGNRGAVPQAADFLDSQPLSKTKTEKKKKRDAANNGNTINTLGGTDSGGFITLPAPPTHSLLSSSNSDSPLGGGSPAPKPGFSRISSAMDSPSGGDATPNGNGNGQHAKVTFGFGVKRKAEYGDVGEEGHSSKRR